MFYINCLILARLVTDLKTVLCNSSPKKRKKHLWLPPTQRSLASLARGEAVRWNITGGLIQWKIHIFQSMFFCLCTGHHLLCPQAVVFQTQRPCWAALSSQNKESGVQRPSLTPCKWSPRRLPAGYCWGSVQSAALRLAGGKQMDKLNVHVHILDTFAIQRDAKMQIWLVVFNHKHFKGDL